MNMTDFYFTGIITHIIAYGKTLVDPLKAYKSMTTIYANEVIDSVIEYESN